MFPSLPKILIFVLVVGAVWWFFRRSQVKRRQQDELDRNPRTRAKNQAAKPIEDMKQCRVCNAYVPAVGAVRCGRENCPF
jgi:hypothetical protein